MNKIALISGASSGIGKAIAKKLAEMNYHLIVLGRRKIRLEELAKYLKNKYGTEVYPLVVDIRKRSEISRAIAALPEHLKAVDLLINNAGLGLGFKGIDKDDINDWETMIDTNIKGVLYLSSEIIPGMTERKSGQIINIGSTVAKQVPKNVSIYAATKHALNAITQGMRIDLLEHGIKVSQINPGYVETEFALVVNKGDTEKAKQTYEGFKALEAKDIAEVVEYLVSLPAHVNINEILITPYAEADVYHLLKQ